MLLWAIDPDARRLLLTTMQSLIGVSASSENLSNFLSQISPQGTPSHITKVYKDCVYFNYHSLGLSLNFVPKPGSGYKLSANLPEDQLNLDKLVLDGVDVYNSLEAGGSKTANAAFRPFPSLPITLHLASTTTSSESVSTSSASPTSPAPPPCHFIIIPAIYIRPQLGNYRKGTCFCARRAGSEGRR